MTVLAIGIFLLGTILARFFKVWILFPVIAAMALAVVAGSADAPLHALLNFAVGTLCLQMGYLCSLFFSMIPGPWQGRRGVPKPPPPAGAPVSATRDQ